MGTTRFILRDFECIRIDNEARRKRRGDVGARCNSLTGSSARAARSEESIEQFATQRLPTPRAHTESSPSRDGLSLYLTLREAQHALSDERQS